MGPRGVTRRDGGVMRVEPTDRSSRPLSTEHSFGRGGSRTRRRFREGRLCCWGQSRDEDWDLLGLRGDRKVSRAEVSRAYRDSMKRWHPDLPGGSLERATAINEAYERIMESVVVDVDDVVVVVDDDDDDVVVDSEEGPSWSGASTAPGDPTALFEWEGEAYWLTPGQVKECEFIASKGWVDECFVMLREFRYANDRWWGAREKRQRERRGPDESA
mmetsp:Transcript_22092/g.46224  ORF Transcript_22092/g.46224 Transcript_22092/m.46224 type:complete len:216 (-) Transcript_22092:1546-2193(-)